MDEAWRIDIRKSVARPPAWARSRLAGLGTDCRRRAREVFAWRGGGGPRTGAPQTDPEPRPWEVREGQKVPRYRVRRDHPAVAVIAKALGAHTAVLEGLLSALELTVPVERIWLDVAEKGGAEAPEPSPDEIAALAEPLAMMVGAIHSSDDAETQIESIMRSLGIAAPALKAAVIAKLKGE
jgi:hypothetical protein